MIEKFNTHWIGEKQSSKKFKRIYFDALVDTLGDKYIRLLIGLRRVGKSTLMKQLIDYLIEEKKLKSSHILYYTFDDGNSLESILTEYNKITNISLEKETTYLFLDEIQKLDNWQNKIKILYDLYPKCKLYLSGSSSVFLRSKESLAGRIFETRIQPLYFDEYLNLKGLSAYTKNPLLAKEKLLIEFEKYLYRQFPDIVDTTLYEAQEYTKTLYSKIIYEDAKLYFSIKHPDILEKLFLIVASQPGMMIDYKNIGDDLQIDPRTVQTYMYYLEQCFLITQLHNYTPSLLTSNKKQKKVYISTCSFYSGSGEITGALFENYLCIKENLTYFWRDSSGRYEIDFIKKTHEGNIIPIEAKYKSELKKKDYSGFKKFKEKYGFDQGYIYSKDIDKTSNDITILPLRKDIPCPTPNSTS